MTNQEIANDIYRQIGGHRFQVMTGAKNLVVIDRGLRFKIGKNGSRANYVRITLNGDDTYCMQFIKQSSVNIYTILLRYADKGLSEAEFNAKVKAAEERARKNAEPQILKEYDGIYCDQLEELFRNYTKLNTRL